MKKQSKQPKKYEQLKILIYEYGMNKLQRAENNYIQWMNNLRNCNPDQLDGLEYILALNELQVTQNVLNEIYDLIKYCNSG